MGSAPRPSVRFRRIGSALRTAREEAGLTMATAGRRFGRSPGWLSIVENGLHPIRMDDLIDLLDFYGVTDETLRASLLYLARQARRKNWTRAYEDRISSGALDLASLESDSAEIGAFEINLIPGLLQTPEYARSVISTGLPSSTRNNMELIAFRMNRQAVFTRPNPPQVSVILGEAALHQQVGGESVMRAQLEHLVDMADSGHINLHILPFSVNTCLWINLPFYLLRLQPPGQLTLTVIEYPTKSIFIEEECEVAEYEAMFSHLLASALEETHSRNFVERLLSEP
jgi:transcriptional regulator with XRE-family HTH domain